MSNNQTHIRISHLKQHFVYRTMASIEADKAKSNAVELPHRHDYFTILAIENAIGTHQMDFRNYSIVPNMVFFIAPEQVHSVNLTEGGASGHVVMFTPEFLLKHSILPEKLTELDLFFNCDEAKPLVLTSPQMMDLTVFFDKIKDEMTADNAFRLDALGAWLKLLLLELKRLKSNVYLKNEKLDKRKSEIVRQFKKDVEGQFRKWHQVQQFAEAQNLTSNYLNEVIKAETGTSAKDFIQSRLLLEAKRLAQYSDMTAKQIAFTLGYEDVAHFSKFFKKCEGVSFSEYAKYTLRNA